MGRDLQTMIKEMTLDEKASLCSGLDFWHTKGIERLGIPSIMMADGPHGLRKQEDSADHLGIYDSVPATCFPASVTLASSWNKNLANKVGMAIGKEAQAKNVATVLGPGVNIKRSPLGGRNFEYFSEDPYLSSELSKKYIEGVQSEGVGTSIKHFAANNQEHRRMTIDTIVDERTLREIYLATFEEVIKEAKPWTVMCSYNKVNGTLASENERLLTEILRDEWNFDGIVVSDWGAVSERVDGLISGLELEMPSSNGINDQLIVDSVKQGELSEEVLDRAVERLLKFIFKAVDENIENATYDEAGHHQFARQVAEESTVLLKNEGEILPIEATGEIAIIGVFAKNPRIQGGGSSRVNPSRLDTAFESIAKVVQNEAEVKYAQGYPLENDDIDEKLLQEAEQLATSANNVVLFVGLPDRYESEGYDRTHLSLPETHLQLINTVAEVNENVIVVLSNGAPVEMPWIDKVKGILEGYLGGQASGSAIANILFGMVNPSGKLAETFPVKLADNPSYLNFPGEGDRVEYKEGIFVGYRYYDKKQLAPLFPFGYGLSYTSFAYSNLEIDKLEAKETEIVTVKVTINKTGIIRRAEIVQLYVKDVESIVNRPEKELKGFQKVFLNPNEEKTVTFSLNKKSFAYYNTDINDWHVESGEFNILIGESSQSILLSESIYLESTIFIHNEVTQHTTLGEILSNPVLAPVAIEHLAELQKSNIVGNMNPEDDDAPDMMQSMLMNMPLRAAVNFTQGAYTREMMEQTIKLFNDTMNRNK